MIHAKQIFKVPLRIDMEKEKEFGKLDKFEDEKQKNNEILTEKSEKLDQKNRNHDGRAGGGND